MPDFSGLKRSGSPREPSGKKHTISPRSSASQTGSSRSSSGRSRWRLMGITPITLVENHAMRRLRRK